MAFFHVENGRRDDLTFYLIWIKLVSSFFRAMPSFYRASSHILDHAVCCYNFLELSSDNHQKKCFYARGPVLWRFITAKVLKTFTRSGVALVFHITCQLFQARSQLKFFLGGRGEQV